MLESSPGSDGVETQPCAPAAAHKHWWSPGLVLVSLGADHEPRSKACALPSCPTDLALLRRLPKAAPCSGDVHAHSLA